MAEETPTGTIRRIQAEINAADAAAAAAAQPPADAPPTPAEARAAVVDSSPVSPREAGTFVLIDGLPALLITPVELLALDGGGHLDVWTVERFTPTGSEIIERHGFADA